MEINNSALMNVSILVPENAVMQAIADPQYLLSAVNQFMAVAGKKPLFNVQLVGLKKQVKINDGLFSINTSQLLKDVKKTDLIKNHIRGGFKEDIYRNMLNNQMMIKEIIQEIMENNFPSTKRNNIRPPDCRGYLLNTR